MPGVNTYIAYNLCDFVSNSTLYCLNTKNIVVLYNIIRPRLSANNTLYYYVCTQPVAFNKNYILKSLKRLNDGLGCVKVARDCHS
jgi:hypothetical protein